MIIVAGEAIVAPQDADAAKAAAIKAAKTTREEAGCIVYQFAEDIEQPGRITIYEEWESLDALQAHLKQPHVAEFGKTLQTLDLQSLSVKRHEAGPPEAL